MDTPASAGPSAFAPAFLRSIPSPSNQCAFSHFAWQGNSYASGTRRDLSIDVGTTHQRTLKEEIMLERTNAVSRGLNRALASLMVAGLVIAGSTLAFSGTKPETIDATAMGTGTQMGEVVNVTLNINDYSSQTDKQTLVQAFQNGKNQGLVDALGKMKAAGDIEGTGTLGSVCTHIPLIPTSSRPQI